jgi:release factor glutamine methyltransferase
MRFLKPPGVYAPQADTRLLTEALRQEGTLRGARALDLGTGTGALAVEAARRGAARVTAVDISARAVATARANALLRGVDVDVLKGDLTAPVRGRRFDLVVCNPPYVPSVTDRLTTRNPGLAWDGGRDGRALVDRVCRDTPSLLAPGGVLLLVHSALCGVEPTLKRLHRAGLRAAVTERRRIPFGPVLRARAQWLASRGLIRPGEQEEELVVIRAERCA